MEWKFGFSGKKTQKEGDEACDRNMEIDYLLS